MSWQSRLYLIALIFLIIGLIVFCFTFFGQKEYVGNVGADLKEESKVPEEKSDLEIIVDKMVEVYSKGVKGIIEWFK